VAQRGRRNADAALLLALACGATVEAATHAAGLSPATTCRRLKDPAFCQRLQDLRADMVQRTAGTLTAAAGEGVKALLRTEQEGVARPRSLTGLDLRYDRVGNEEVANALPHGLTP
jgi:hypothetical protein